MGRKRVCGFLEFLHPCSPGTEISRRVSKHLASFDERCADSFTRPNTLAPERITVAATRNGLPWSATRKLRGSDGGDRTGARSQARDFRLNLKRMAGWTGLEPAASGVTGRRSNQLNYHPGGTLWKFEARSRSRRCVDVTSPTLPFELPTCRRLANRSSRSGAKVGGRCRTRTCDSRRVKPVLYH